jgi:RNA polymerase sigma-70 factor, ECF subfamily
MDGSDTFRYVIRLIDSLPGEYREAIRLCDLEHLSFEQIAEKTGLSMDDVKRRIQRGRFLLRRKVEVHLRR